MDNSQEKETKDVVRVISTIAFVATYILYSLDCNGWGSACLLLTIITRIYSDGWRATLFVCGIFATLIMSVYISMQFVENHFLTVVVSLIISLCFALVYWFLYTTYLCHVYKGYLRYVHKKMYWVIDRFEESGFCMNVGDEITQKVFLSNGDIGIVMDLPDHLGSSIRVVGKRAGNNKIWMINSIKTLTNEKAVEKVLYELQLYGIE
jgi:hypothetical protein